MDKKENRIRLYLVKNSGTFREHNMIKKGKSVAYVAIPNKKERTFEIVSASNEKTADLSLTFKNFLWGGIVPPLVAKIHVYEPDFEFEFKIPETGLLLGAEDFSIICLKENHYFVNDGDVEAIVLKPCSSSVEAYCADEKYEFLAVAMMMALQVYRNRGV